MIRFNFKLIPVIFILSVVPIIFVGCEGCSRYGVEEAAIQDGNEDSDYDIDIIDENDQEENNDEEDQKENIDNPPNTTSTTLTLTELFKKYKSAVFMIYTSDGESTGQGSGFFITPDGLGISNYHVFKGTKKGAEIIRLESGEELKITEVIAADEENDYIIFKVRPSGTLNYFRTAASLPEIGDEVFAIGNPKGLEHTLSTGIISGYRGEKKGLIQTTTSITYGSSGGPLLNMSGEVVGITTGGMGEANLNFAVNVNLLNNYFPEPINSGINKTTSLKFYPIKKFVDGDTFWIDNGTEKGEKIRFIGVDTPESRKTFNKEVGYYGKEAKKYVENLLKGKKVRLEYDVDIYDRYGRTLAYIYLKDGTFLNAKLIEEGYAVVMTVPPNVKYVDLFVKLQKEARESKRGLWK